MGCLFGDDALWIAGVGGCRFGAQLSFEESEPW